jgi:DNA repair photolyase
MVAPHVVSRSPIAPTVLPIFLHKPGAAGLPAALRRGRAAAENRLSGRFAALESILDPDLFDASLNAENDDDFLSTLRTTINFETPKHVISRNSSPDLPFDRSINAYRGCEHGCVYCFARPTHAYLGLSPGLDFETRLTAKQNVPALLRAELSKPSYRAAPIAMGTNTDPYQPIEKRFEITRSILDILEEFGHPCTLTTKNHLITRDIDILARLAKRNLVVVNISITTLDAKLSRAMEPRASTPAKRLETIEKLTAAGIPVNVFVSPLIPGLNDHELERILAAAKTAGASGASSIHLRLPHEVKDIFKTWLKERMPDRAERVMHHIRDMRAGNENDPRFGHRMQGSGVYAELLRARFNAACTRLGLARERFSLVVNQFRVPGAIEQLNLFAA